MKYIRLFSAFFIMISLILQSGCFSRADVSAKALLEAIEDCFEEPLPACQRVFDISADHLTRFHLSPSLASLIYYGEKRDELFELSLLSECIIRLADGDSGAEIHILRSKASSHVDTLEKLLYRRLNYIKSRSLYIYAPENYEKYSFTATVLKRGNYLFLLATPDNQTAVKVIDKML